MFIPVFPSRSFGNVGMYIVKLYCDNQWVASTTLLLPSEYGMNPNDAISQKHEPKDEFLFIGELQQFTDPPGGASLDDPQVRNRPRKGRPQKGNHSPNQSKENES